MTSQVTPDGAADPGGGDADGLGALTELALDLRSAWDRGADHLWRRLDAPLWEFTRNPCTVLQTVSAHRIREALADPAFRSEVDRVLDIRRAAAAGPAWFDVNHPASALKQVAYFSMEFMLSEALPIYSGGLGNVAGDQLKSASDLGVPVVGVGLLYQQGYFRQIIDRAGGQQALFPFNSPDQLPITPLRTADGEWLRLQVDLPGFPVWLRTWQAQVGRVRLLLLDSNDPANFPAWRGITSELYGGGPELRLRQELILGIGGWRLLSALGILPEVCHLNEGHAAFAVLERARAYMRKSGLDFAAALATTRAGNLFTTHTAVAAGFDRFAPELIVQYLGEYARTSLGISTEQLLALGRANDQDWSESFNMAYLAIRGSGAVSGVSRLHGKVSRQIFGSLFPRWPEEEVPVGHITNGVHMPTWDSVQAEALWAGACAADCWQSPDGAAAVGIRRLSDAQLWRFRNESRAALIDSAREQLTRMLMVSGESADAVEGARQLLDPNTLTLGFARRFATYKRPNLLLRDTARLLRLLSHADCPVQLIIAGKAHPADEPGQALIRQWVQFIRGTDARNHVIFLADYDMYVAQQLVQGVDVWINTPRRPWEACGTSGMKVLVNGGINLSQLDGWWAEAYQPDVGWAIGDAQTHGDEGAWDDRDAAALYEVLERDVVPQFYTRDAAGIPTAWIARMRESMVTLTPQFSSSRAVHEYTQRSYLPAAQEWLRRSAGDGAGQRLLRWRERLDRTWSQLRFGPVTVATTASGFEFDVSVYLAGLAPQDVAVQLYANGIDGEGPKVYDMTLQMQPAAGDAAGCNLYRVAVPANRPAGDYTARVIPRLAGAAVPLEANHILWQR
ncbi:MAG TPA: alpha-glucan family phosphorylase [Steroidobacteraceae bacterium]|nr:alpha-glucan family phosphorylase [Steroidobacteraceae bacterium]